MCTSNNAFSKSPFNSTMIITQPEVILTVCSQILKAKSSNIKIANHYSEEKDEEYYYSFFFDQFKPNPACRVSCTLCDKCGEETIQTYVQ